MAKTSNNISLQAAAAAAAVVANDIAYIKADISEIKRSVRDLSGEYITRVEFEPIKRIVYGVVGLLGVATLGAVFKLIFIR